MIVTLLSETILRAYANEKELCLACERGMSPVENGENEHERGKLSKNLNAQFPFAKVVNRLSKNLRQAAEKYSCSKAFEWIQSNEF